MLKSWRTYLFFVGIIALVFLVHSALLTALSIELWSSILIKSYVINASLGLSLIAIANYLLVRQSSYVGWAFIGISGLKFILFFALISPDIKQDTVTSSVEFAAFFVPYLGCLFMELRFLAKRLNAL